MKRKPSKILTLSGYHGSADDPTVQPATHNHPTPPVHHGEADLYHPLPARGAAPAPPGPYGTSQVTFHRETWTGGYGFCCGGLLLRVGLPAAANGGVQGLVARIKRMDRRKIGMVALLAGYGLLQALGVIAAFMAVMPTIGGMVLCTPHADPSTAGTVNVTQEELDNAQEETCECMQYYIEHLQGDAKSWRFSFIDDFENLWLRGFCTILTLNINLYPDSDGMRSTNGTQSANMTHGGGG